MNNQTFTPPKLLGVSFSAADFHTLSHHARKHKKPVKEFIEWAMCCYINSMRQEEQARAK